MMEVKSRLKNRTLKVGLFFVLCDIMEKINDLNFSRESNLGITSFLCMLLFCLLNSRQGTIDFLQQLFVTNFFLYDFFFFSVKVVDN